MIELPPELAQAIHEYLLARQRAELAALRETEALAAALRQCKPKEPQND